MNYLFLLLLLSGWGGGCNLINNGCNSGNNGCGSCNSGCSFCNNGCNSYDNGCNLGNNGCNCNSSGNGIFRESGNSNEERSFPSFAPNSCGCEMENS